MAATPENPAPSRPAARAATAARASGPRLPRAAERQRAVQEGRRRAATSGPGSRTSTSTARLRLDRPGRPARPVPLVGPLHPAHARASTAARPRCSSRRSSTTSTSCCGSASTAALLTTEQLRAIGEISHRVRPRHRRRHRPAEHPVHWIRIEDVPGDLAAARGRRAVHHRGLRRLPAGRSSARRSPASPPTRSSTAPRPSRRSSAASSATRSSPTCRASSRPRSPGSRSQDVAPEINDIAFVGVVHPEHGPGFDLWVGGGLSTNPMLGAEARRLGAARRGRRRLGGRRRRSSATTATAGCAPAPG